MPRNFMFTKEEIVQAALDLTREQGSSAVTARALGKRLGSSSRPVFSYFSNMAEVQAATIQAAQQLYQQYLAEDMAAGKYPTYKASGMAYIRFAKEEKELFRLLFMRDRTNETKEQSSEEIAPLIALLQRQLHITKSEAMLFHLEMWVYVHGIATMIATGYLDWENDFISRALTDVYTGLKHRFSNSSKESASS